jgi:flagellar protein FliT
VSQVEKLHEVTKELYQLVDQQSEKRDELIQSVQHLLDKRELLINDLKGPYSAEEQVLGKEIVELNQVINTRFEQIKSNIKNDLSVTKTKKTTNKHYANPYKSVNIDGMFFDKRN